MTRRHEFDADIHKKQMSFADMVALEMDYCFARWTEWRDAQTDNDFAKALVDSTFVSRYRELELLYNSLTSVR